MSKDNSDYETSEHTHTCKVCTQIFDCNDDICVYLLLAICPSCAASDKTRVI